MSAALRERLSHALLSLLLAAGIILPLLGILLPGFSPLEILLPVMLTVLLFEAASLRRGLAVGVSLLSLAALLLWLFAGGGITPVTDVFRALLLRIRGVTTALPLVAVSAVRMISVGLTFLCCLACLRSVSVLPASLLCVSTALLIYLTASEPLIPWLLPAVAAFLILLARDRFPETPLLSLLPWMALLVAAAFLLAGPGTGENRFTRQADDLRQQILDRLFFTEPRDVFSLSSEGYYPEGQDQLGGRPEPHEGPVMEVSAPRTVYLRGVILNEYTGRSWINTTAGRRLLWQSPRFRSQQRALFDMLLPAETVQNSLCAPLDISVRMLSDSASTLFVPQRVRTLTAGGDLVPYFSNASEIFITRNLQPGDTYSVSAPLFQAGDSGLGTLIEVCSTLEDPGWERVLDLYTSLPGHLDPSLYDLAREVASAGITPYDRAMALQSWLSRSFRYTLDVDEQPRDVDFVTRFLTDTKEGYCTYFASAMTVLCRMAGLPARYVEGYLAEPDASGRALVTGLDGHAWTEVYFRGFGWLTFDATPRTRASGADDGTEAPSPAPDTPKEAPESTKDTPEPPEETPEPPEDTPEPEDPSDAADTPTPEPESEPSPAPDDSSAPEPSPDPDSQPSPEPETPPDGQTSFPWLWLLLLLPLLLLLLRIRMTSPAFRARRAADMDGRLDVWAQEIFDLLRAEGFVRKKDESPMAFGRRVDRMGFFSVALGPVGECISLIRYSSAHASETDITLVQDSAILLKSELSRPARLKYLLRRIFLPLPRRSYAA